MLRSMLLLATSFLDVTAFDVLDAMNAPTARRLGDNVGTIQPSPAPADIEKITEGSLLSAATFVPYPGYTGNLAAAGTVAIATVDTTQTIEMAFTGLDPACSSGAGPAANSCGVHIHSGKTCSDASLVGGHYFTGAVTADPWTSVAYTSSDGTYANTVSVITGGDAAAVAGRAFIVHGYDGGRIACALLLDPSLPTPFSPPPSSPLPPPPSRTLPPPPSSTPSSPSVPPSKNDDSKQKGDKHGEDSHAKHKGKKQGGGGGSDGKRIAIICAVIVVPAVLVGLAAACYVSRQRRRRNVKAGPSSAVEVVVEKQGKAFVEKQEPAGFESVPV